MGSRSYNSARAGGKTGMTLVELLVVMGIIAIIASAIVAAAVQIHVRSQARQAANLMEQIAQALDQYQGIHRMYVPDGDAGATHPLLRTHALWQALEHDPAAKFSVEGRFKRTDTVFTDPFSNQYAKLYYYVDAWESPLDYTCQPPYTSFTLRSVGRDQEWMTDDDIVRSNP